MGIGGLAGPKHMADYTILDQTRSISCHVARRMRPRAESGSSLRSHGLTPCESKADFRQALTCGGRIYRSRHSVLWMAAHPDTI